MKHLFGLSIACACALTGCTMIPPVQIRSAPPPTAAQISQMRDVQTRVVAVPPASVFPGVMDVLMDNGYVIRSADAPLGLVAFYQRWTDPQQFDAIIAIEGNAIFEPAGANSTRIRLLLTGGSQRLETTGGGPHSSDSGMVGKAQQSADMAEYQKLLDLLEQGLTAKPN